MEPYHGVTTMYATKSNLISLINYCCWGFFVNGLNFCWLAEPTNNFAFPHSGFSVVSFIFLCTFEPT